MGWKDTVMDKEQLDILPAVDAYPPTYSCLNDYFRTGKKQIAEAQAEISYKAGYDEGQKQDFIFQRGFKAGIREVVAWMYEPCPHAPRNFPSDKRMCVQCCETKLKEWGINKEGVNEEEI